MVDIRKLGFDVDDAINTGRDNAVVRPDVEGWCEHLVVELLGISPVGQMAGVPIGPHRISCQHAPYSTESIVLRRLFQGFLIDNCAGCCHHRPGLRVDFGQAFLTAAEEQKSKTSDAESKRHLQIESLRKELLELADQLATAAQPEAGSVLRLTADLFADAQTNATQMLCETSEVAPELFVDKVFDLLELGVTDEVFAVKCLPVIACLARKDLARRDRLRPHVIESTQLDLPIEVIAEAVNACLSEDGKEITDQLIDKLVASQNYQRPIGGWADKNEPVFTTTVALLVKLIDLVAESVTAVLEKRLEINQKRSRANTCRVVEELSKLRPEFGLRVLPRLIRSLELDDDAYEGVSADGSALHAVSELLVVRWSETEQILRHEAPRLSTEAQVALVGAYKKLFLRGDNWRNETTEGLSESIVSGAVDRCLELLIDTTREPGVRRAAAEAVHTACRAGAQSVLGAFDQLFGCLAIIADSKPPAPPPKIILPGQEEFQRQEAMHSQQDREFEWMHLKRQLTEVVEEIGKRNPLNVCKALLSTIDAATSVGRTSLKLLALNLLGDIASHESEVSIIALPSIMVCLMDYSSPAVRSSAINAVRDAFSHSQLTVPSNVVDVIIVHLRDQYVVVHKSALNAIRFGHIPLTELQRTEAFNSLYCIWKAYAKDSNEAFFMDDIADALLTVAYDDIDLRNLTLSLICDYLPIDEVLVDSKLCEHLIRATDIDASLAVTVAKTLIECLARHDRDPYRNGRDWRENAADWLSSLPRQVWIHVAAEFSLCAQQIVQKDPGDALLFASVLCEHCEHGAEGQVLAFAAKSAEGHSLFHGLREPLMRIHKRAAACQGEVAR